MLRLYWAPYGKLEAQYAIDKANTRYPKASVIADRMRSLSGSIYVWGWNDPKGIPSLEKYYPAKVGLASEFKKKWILQGVDCSGLLYHATDGMTPRNTSSLVTFGTGVTIAGKSAEEIAASLKPLDLIAWKGHTLIVLDDSHVIESNWSMGGVRISDTKQRIAELLATRAPLDAIADPIPEGKTKGFVVRRWYEEKN